MDKLLPYQLYQKDLLLWNLTRNIRINDRVIKAWADILLKYQILNSLLIVKFFNNEILN